MYFLGGTVGNNNWREGFIAKLREMGVAGANIFNPVAGAFNPAIAGKNPIKWEGELQAMEDDVKARTDTVTLFYVGDTKDGTGLPVYSIAEATMGLYDRPERTVVVFDQTGVGGHHAKALDKIVRDLRGRFPAGRILTGLDEAAALLASGELKPLGAGAGAGTGGGGLGAPLVRN